MNRTDALDNAADALCRVRTHLAAAIEALHPLRDEYAIDLATLRYAQMDIDNMTSRIVQAASDAIKNAPIPTAPGIWGSHSAEDIRKALAGDLAWLSSAFGWAVSPQGHAYWQDRSDGTVALTDEDRRVLAAWADEYDARTARGEK